MVPVVYDTHTTGNPIVGCIYLFKLTYLLTFIFIFIARQKNVPKRLLACWRLETYVPTILFHNFGKVKF